MKLTAKSESILHVQEYGDSARIDGVESVALRRFNDDGGSMLELFRFNESRPAGLEGFDPQQLNYSVVQPGAIKAFHLHRKQTDLWFVPPEDRVLLVLFDVRADSSTEGACLRLILGDGNNRFVRIPPGVAHGCRNLAATPARILYLTDLTFDPSPANCDEGRLPWDYAGADVWDMVKE